MLKKFLLLFLLLATPAFAGNVSLAWDASTSANIAGYKVYVGQASRIYGTPVSIPNQTTWTVENLPTGTFYFAVTAFNTDGYESGFSNEVFTTLGSPPDPPDPPDPSLNYIQNPGFELGMTNWTFFTNGQGVSAIVTPGFGSSGSALQLSIQQNGSNTQLYQPQINLKAQASYKLSLQAKSSTGRDYRLTLQKHVSPFSNYGLRDFICHATADWTPCSSEFTATNFAGTVSDARLMVWLAADATMGTEYQFDDFKLEEIVPPPPVNKCDLNQDFSVNVVDLQIEINSILGQSSGVDVNGDGSTNVVDLQLMINAILTGTNCQ